MAEAQPVGIREALRRVVVGFRGAVGVWVAALVMVALFAGSGDPRLLVAIAIAALLWAALTVVLAQRRPDLVSSWVFLAADAAVTATLVIASDQAQAEPQVYGAFPFSAVLLAAYLRGYAGGLAVAALLTVVSVMLSSAAGAVTSTFIYLVGGATSAWAMTVLRRADDRQRRLAAQLGDERAERARADERAEAANALHDSVLQTLALVQRRKDDPVAVSTLARRGERELRRWVSGERSSEPTIAAALDELAAEIEQLHGLTVDVVSVGDHHLDDAARALVAAAREALTNVAKHAGTQTASVYSEVTPDEIVVSIRDRGAGFDTATIAPGRHGLEASITQRVERAGGRATVTSRPGAGTEVELVLPRPRQDSTGVSAP